jgi:hypothetical protein
VLTLVSGKQARSFHVPEVNSATLRPILKAQIDATAGRDPKAAVYAPAERNKASFTGASPHHPRSRPHQVNPRGTPAEMPAEADPSGRGCGFPFKTTI